MRFLSLKKIVMLIGILPTKQESMVDTSNDAMTI